MSSETAREKQCSALFGLCHATDSSGTFELPGREAGVQSVASCGKQPLRTTNANGELVKNRPAKG